MSAITSEISFNQTATLMLSDANKNELISLAIKNIIEIMSSSWYYCTNEGGYGWLVNETNFEGLWNDRSDLRKNLVTILINCRNSHSYGNTLAFSTDFSNQKLSQIEAILLNNEDDDSDQIRRSIIPAIYPNFDYKSEILRLSEVGRTQSIINSWIELAASHSKDEELFEFLLSNIKRAEGATELKVNILSKAFINDVICENYIKKIAVSAPISLKRTVVGGLCQAMRSWQSQYRYSRHSLENEAQLKEKLDRVENLAMLFACLNDRQILRDLGSNLSIKNLPWILPAAANHPWIVKEIQRRIDREGV